MRTPVASSDRTLISPPRREPARLVRAISAAPRPLIAILLLGAALRFATLGSQSYWYDEAVTATLMQKSLGGMLTTLPHMESTPPLFYVIEWMWARMFGTSEIGLRSFSAILGTAFVAVSYGVALTFVRRQTVALVVALFAAVSPIIVWYSQEARSYALYAFLCALSMLFLGRALEARTPRSLWTWAGCSAVALTSHYFAAFLIVGEAVVLIVRLGARRCWAPIGAVGVVGITLVPLAYYQNLHVAAGASISTASLRWRIEETGIRFTFLYYNPLGRAALFVALLTAIVLAYRARRVPGVGTLMFLALAELGLPILLALTGIVDVFFFRNVLAAWLPLAVVLAAGLPRSRGGMVLAVAISLVLLGSTLAVDARSGLQRDSWRQASHALKQFKGPRLVVGDSLDMAYTLPFYWPNLEKLPASGANIREIDLVGRYLTASSRLPSLPGFKTATVDMAGNITILRLRSRQLERVTPADLSRSGEYGSRLVGNFGRNGGGSSSPTTTATR